TFHSALLDHLTSPPSIEACRERVHLALSWLSHEHARLAAAPTADAARYDEVAIALLEAYRERLPPNERLWTTLLLEAPRL
ncbi:hypothetical protein INO08_16500, partial [Staphylococcus aureus]|nr:hypothetical protein [Staphylococcus aureus]